MFEVQDLKYATLATVSRCGMVWFSEDVLSTQVIFENYLARLRHVPLEEGEEDASALRSKTTSGAGQDKQEDLLSPTIQLQRDVANIFATYLTPDGLVSRCLEYAATKIEHVMDFTRFRALNALFSMLNQAVRNILNYNHTHPDFPMQPDQLERFVPKALIYAILWSFAGDGKLKGKKTSQLKIYLLI